jgi:hypothetical protein
MADTMDPSEPTLSDTLVEISRTFVHTISSPNSQRLFVVRVDRGHRRMNN